MTDAEIGRVIRRFPTTFFLWALVATVVMSLVVLLILLWVSNLLLGALVTGVTLAVVCTSWDIYEQGQEEKKKVEGAG